jgi:hypothetical protein
MCAGCQGPFTNERPVVHCCQYVQQGFPFEHAISASPCGVFYHSTCVRTGKPFRTWLADKKGLMLAHQVLIPHFICEACHVWAELGRELQRTKKDISLLLLEWMRQIDVRNHWQQATLIKDGPKLRALACFDLWCALSEGLQNCATTQYSSYSDRLGQAAIFSPNDQGKRRQHALHCIWHRVPTLERGLSLLCSGHAKLLSTTSYA